MNVMSADKNRRDLNAEFQPELTAFTNYLLSIPDELVTKTLREAGDTPECKLQFWQSRLVEDSLAAWIDDCVIHDPSAKTPVGGDINEADRRKPETLFGSYGDYCRNSNLTCEGVWGSYKSRAVISDSASGYMDSPSIFESPLWGEKIHLPSLLVVVDYVDVDDELPIPHLPKC